MYIRYPEKGGMPLRELKAFKRVFVQKGGKQTVEYEIPVAELMKWDKNWVLYAGNYDIVVGAHSRDARLTHSFKTKTTVRK